MGKGSQTSSSSMPGWYEDMAKQQAQQAQMVGQLPYMPWMGVDVAAPSPQLQAAWGMPAQMMNAFGGGGVNAMTPAFGTAGQQGGGNQFGGQPVPGGAPGLGGGYSSWPGFNQQLQMMEQHYPGIMEAYYNANPAAAGPVATGPDGMPAQGAQSQQFGGQQGEGGQSAPGGTTADQMRWFQMSNAGGEIDPVAGPSNVAYSAEYRRLQDLFGGQDFGSIAGPQGGQ